MGLELVIFIAAVLFGIFLYWRESNSNNIYRFVNKVFNSAELQMDSSNKKGFVYKQTFLPRLVFVATGFLILALILQFLTPFKIFSSYMGISTFASTIVGTLIGTYLASFVLKSTEVIDEKSDSIEDLVIDTIEKGKDFIEDLKPKDTQDGIEAPKETPKVGEKSARERLKDKGLL